MKKECVRNSVLFLLHSLTLCRADVFDEISSTLLPNLDRNGILLTTPSWPIIERAQSVLTDSSNKDLLKLTEHEIKRSELEWGWDKWCQLQPKRGNCSSSMLIYYYDTQTDRCREFVYSGCNGNQNKFTRKGDCELFCKGFGLVPDVRTITKVESCGMQPNPGTCLSYGTKFYFDVNRRSCKEFVYGGCGGNPNRFADENSCLQDCLQSGA